MKMNFFRWKWILPLLQLLFASVGLVYGPHQFRETARRRGISGDNNTVEYFSQNFPAPVERISKGINFPALVLAYPLRGYDNAIYSKNTAYTLVWISPRELGFLAGIVAFWYWVGRKLDQSQRPNPTIVRYRASRMAALVCGFAFAILTGAYALHMSISEWRPERHIGAFGIVWSLVLLVYFAWRSSREFRGQSI